MNSLPQTNVSTDLQLVNLSLAGNREAFGQLVQRHQALVCSLAYSACGDLARSEDLAQETFVTAWRQLKGLREPERFKSWLCGIARNLVNNQLRRDHRRGEDQALTLEAVPDAATTQPDPQQAAISREDQALVWEALAAIPENYREPLVLFYREEQSVQSVAAALDISEEAARQRLSRGRVLLREAISRMVEETLTATRPGPAFTMAVLAALPFTLTQAAAATTAATAVKGSTTAKTLAAAGLWSGIGGAILGVAGGILGAYAGRNATLAQAGSERERQVIRGFFRWTVASTLLFAGTLLALVWWGRGRHWEHARLFFGLIVGWNLLFMIALSWSSFALTRRLRSIRAEEKAAGRWTAPPAQVWTAANPQAEGNYTSRATWLGLPLVDRQFGRFQDGEYKRGVARGWIAIGDVALGVLFAGGGVAVGGIACGGCAVGLLSLGGAALGLLTFGGAAVGIWALGGGALGIWAIGGGAVGWVAAYGGGAWAKYYALGGGAWALHAQDAVAKDYFQSSTFFQAGKWIMEHSRWMLVLTFLPMLLAFRTGNKTATTRTPPKG